MKIFKALTIAGSDSGGGAGIQADLKTFQELDVFGMSAITAVTAQNTQGVQGVYPMTVEAVKTQIESVATDLQPDAIKTGMLFSADIIYAVAESIKAFQWNQVVVDPVMIAKGGASLLQDEAVQALIEALLPLTTVLTPNLPEAEVLTGITIQNLDDRKKAAEKLKEMGAKYIVIKGGHDEDSEEIIDMLFDGETFFTYSSQRVHTPHTHGTGCTFSAAITAQLAKGSTVTEAVQTAKTFIAAAVEQNLGIGSGHGPTNHWAYRKSVLRGEHVDKTI